MVVESGSRVSGVGRVESGRYSSYLFFENCFVVSVE